MDDLKSIAVPVTRKSRSAAAPRRRGRTTLPADGVAGARPAPAAPTPVALVHIHRYHVGQQLVMAGGGNHWSRARSLCRVLFLMPAEGSNPLRYRVRSEEESYDRIVDEADLALPG